MTNHDEAVADLVTAASNLVGMADWNNPPLKPYLVNALRDALVPFGVPESPASPTMPESGAQEPEEEPWDRDACLIHDEGCQHLNICPQKRMCVAHLHKKLMDSEISSEESSYVPAWQAHTYYTFGDLVRWPNGTIHRARHPHLSGAEPIPFDWRPAIPEVMLARENLADLIGSAHSDAFAARTADDEARRIEDAVADEGRRIARIIERKPTGVEVLMDELEKALRQARQSVAQAEASRRRW